jgi:hypothetical protein
VVADGEIFSATTASGELHRRPEGYRVVNGHIEMKRGSRRIDRASPDSVANDASFLSNHNQQKKPYGKESKESSGQEEGGS